MTTRDSHIGSHYQHRLSDRVSANTSEVIAEPRNCSTRRRSKSSLSTLLFASPVGFAITAPVIRHLLGGLLRQSVFGRLAGYEDVNDADRLCRDPAMRWVAGDRAIIGSAASASQMGRFETKWLSRPDNLVALADLPGQWIDKVHQRRPPKTIVLDMDSSESPTYGEQEGSA